MCLQCNSTDRPKVVKGFHKSNIIEDDFGVSVRRAITHCKWTPGDMELFGEVTGNKDLLNRQTVDTGLAFDDAELLALTIESAWMKIEPNVKRKKRKS